MCSNNQGNYKKNRTDQNINISQLKKGDHSELRKFANVGSYWVYNVVYGYVMNKEDTEEVVQDCLIAALNGLPKFKNEASLKTWMYKISINKSKDLLKHRSRQKRSGTMVEIQDTSAVEHFHPGVQLESKEEMNYMAKGINLLPENQKTALIMAKFDHKSQAEIAEIMKVSVKAVESLLSRAKTNFRKYLENQDI